MYMSKEYRECEYMNEVGSSYWDCLRPWGRLSIQQDMEVQAVVEEANMGVACLSSLCCQQGPQGLSIWARLSDIFS